MTEMKILPVERAIEWIRAWTELDWPITWETAFATRDKLGWTPAPDDGRFFTTELSTDSQEDGNLTRFEGQCSGASFQLSSLALSAAADERWATSLRSAYDSYIKELTYLYGVGEASSGRGGRQRTKWILANQVTLSMSVSDKSINVTIKSPAVTAINERERYYIEKYGENYVDD
ncbi:DUF6301 family protein [Actinomyces succiniciruminis]|uniref:Uncharacterized protein n=1 Tax=Actinomyces succiniciruminis TaxID=1522002 RepID=A0A1L7RK56_9ACTO|nr:DUF6301 family protein [Actinomyces succiniciruminis]CED92406.1 Hypothetical protein AAM4_2574 [Actinomyces succiniciruminis]